ncbi:MAG: tetratricopeptide repeat protein [Cyanobacteria bacterium P01_D01_bin.123]
MDDSFTQRLLVDLKSADESTRQWATRELWRQWFYQKGEVGFAQIERSQALLEEGNVSQAKVILCELIRAEPDFAEAWNRRAVLYFSQKDYPKAIADCREVLALNPVHFGALNGLGLCYAATGDYRAAISSFRRALEIQPYSLENQRMILECTRLLS